MDLGFLGNYSTDDTFQHMVQCRDGSLVSTTPDAAPTFYVYDEDGTEIETGSLGSSDHDGRTGLRRGTSTLSAANGYSVGLYRAYYTYAISTVNHADMGVFRII